MTKSPITISPRDSAEHAIRLMDGAHVDHLPVCEGKRLVGIVARTDLLERTRRLLSRGKNAEDLQELLPYVQIAGIMTLDPPGITPDSTIAAAADRMRAAGLSALAVVEDQELVGILTSRDLWPSIADRPGSASAAR